ncbi:MAG: AAA family ATPase [Acidimicrobiales bacterium]|nr:AAA family ATPase [Acidimicrobiales bacterium]
MTILPRPLVEPLGRDAEQLTINRAIDAALDGRASALLITGEAGAGKTTLARWAADVARSRGARVVFARCYASKGATPFAAVVESIGKCLRQLRPDVRDEMVAGLPTLGLLFEGVTGIAPTGAPGGEELSRTRLLDAIAVLLERLARDVPLMWVVDDLQLADEATLDLLQYLTPDLGFLLLATVRTDDLDAAGGVRPVLVDLRRHGATTVELDRLDRDGVVTLLTKLLGGPTPPGVVDLAVERSRGVPLYVTELVSDLIERGLLQHDGTVWRFAGGRVPPLSLAKDLLADRLSMLERDERRAVELLAASPGPLAAESLALLVPDGGETLARLATRGLVTDEIAVDGTAAWALAHPLTRDAALAGCTASHLRSLHLDLLGVTPETDVDLRAHHLLGSAQTGPAVAAILLAAGRRALERGAPHRARELLEHASQNARPDGDPALVSETDLWLAEAHCRHGDWGTAHEMFARMAAELVGSDDPTELSDLLIRWANVAWRAGDRTALPAARSRLICRLADSGFARLEGAQIAEEIWSELRDGRPTPSGRLDRLRLLVTADPDSSLAVDLWLAEQATVFATFGFTRAALERTRELAGRASTTPHQRIRLLNLALDIGVLQESWTEVARLEAASIDATGAVGQSPTWRVALTRSQRLLVAGHLVEAAEVDFGYADLRMSPTRLTAVKTLLRGLPLVYLGRFADVRQLIADARRSAGPAGLDDYDRAYIATVEGLLGIHSDDPGAMSSAVDQVLLTHCSGAASWQIAASAECCARLGRLDELASITDMSRAQDDGQGQATAWAVRAGAVAARLRDDLPGAHAGFLDAAHRFDRLAMPIETARALVDAADCGEVSPDRLVEAAQFLVDAQSAEADRARALLARRHGGMPVAVRTDATHDGDSSLTRREREVAELVAEGLTNREVAERLFISIRTVTSHLDHIYTKLGLSSRRQLTEVLSRSRTE